MPIEFGPPPQHRAPRRSYHDIFSTLAEHPGVWVSLPLDEVNGDTQNRKTSLILSAAATRGVKVQTSVQGGRVYVRVVEGVSVHRIETKGESI
jgi:hypothetical protein